MSKEEAANLSVKVTGHVAALAATRSGRSIAGIIAAAASTSKNASEVLGMSRTVALETAAKAAGRVAAEEAIRAGKSKAYVTAAAQEAFQALAGYAGPIQQADVHTVAAIVDEEEASAKLVATVAAAASAREAIQQGNPLAAAKVASLQYVSVRNEVQTLAQQAADESSALGQSTSQSALAAGKASRSAAEGLGVPTSATDFAARVAAAVAAKLVLPRCSPDAASVDKVEEPCTPEQPAPLPSEPEELELCLGTYLEECPSVAESDPCVHAKECVSVFHNCGKDKHFNLCELQAGVCRSGSPCQLKCPSTTVPIKTGHHWRCEPISQGEVSPQPIEVSV